MQLYAESKLWKMMSKIKVLITCCNIHATDIIRSIVNNDYGIDVEVYVTNSKQSEMPDASLCAEQIVVPPITSEYYVPKLLEIVAENEINVILPISSIDLELLSLNKAEFEKCGCKVSVMDYHKLVECGNKENLYKNFRYIMPDTMMYPLEDAISFVKKHDRVCCKFTDQCGGKGFAVVDDEKSIDMKLFHRYGEKQYISKSQLFEMLCKTEDNVMLQQYISGKDYTVSVLAESGKVKRIVGYVGYVLEFGAIMHGEISRNNEAYEIAEYVVDKLKLDGNVALDFIVTDNKVYLLEVNPRVNASMSFVNKAGCNMAMLRIMQLVGYSIPEEHERIEYGLKMKKDYATRYFI